MPSIIHFEMCKDRDAILAGHDAVEKIKDNFETITMLMGSRDDYIVPTDEDLKQSVQTRLDFIEERVRIVRIPFTFEHAESSLRRVMEESPPNGFKNQQFKDLAIWEAILELARSFEVVFVTEDKAFFQDRDPRKGLAQNLRDDIASAGGGVVVYYELATYLEALREQIPTLNLERIATQIDRIIRTHLQDMSKKLSKTDSTLGFELQEITEHKISPFLTENTDILATSYSLNYRAFRTIRLGDAPRVEVKVYASGTCSISARDESVFDVKNAKVEVYDPNGDSVQVVENIIYASASITIGRGRVPFRWQKQLGDLL